MSKSTFYMNSPIGILSITVQDSVLLGVDVESSKSKNKTKIANGLNFSSAEAKLFARVKKQLDEYFSGKRHEFDLPLHLNGTEFQNKVWRALLKVPYGKYCTYSEIAQRIHNKNAVRAVGSAVGKNPFLILIPCHRILPKSGGLGSFSAGTSLKANLLLLENVTVRR